MEKRKGKKRDAVSTPLKAAERDPALCKATTRAGTACMARATDGGLCFFHANPNKAAELGRLGGQKNRHVFDALIEDVSPPKNAVDVKELLADTMAKIRSGKLDPKLGTTLAYIGTALLKAMEVSDIEQRLQRLELEKH